MNYIYQLLLLAVTFISFHISAQKNKEINPSYKLEPLEVNSVLSEIVNHYQDGYLYVYRNKPFYKFRSKYYDVYKIKANKAVTKGKFKLIDSDLNTRFNEGPIAFDNKRNLAYVTRNVYSRRELRRKNLALNPLKVDVYELVDGDYQYKEEFEFNNKEYSVGHVCYSESTNRLYFSSTQAGGIGEADLYVCDVKEDGSFENLRNLGKKINTKKQEAFTVINNGVMFFASTGKHRKRSRKDLDIYYVTEKGLEKGERVKSLKAPFNSSWDDFGLAFINAQEGYLTSNRGYDEDYNHNIYYFDLGKPIISDNQFNLLIEFDDENRKKVIAARPKLRSTKTGEFIDLTIVEDGFIAELLNENEEYELVFGKGRGFENKKIGPFTKSTIDDVFKTTGIKIIERMEVDTVVEIAKVDFDNDSIYKLDNLRIKDGDSAINFADVLANLKDDEVDQGKIIQLNNIYFALNSAKLGDDASEELDILVEYLKNNDNRKVKIWAHTDSRGSNELNNKLSLDRAKSVSAYLIKNEVDSKNIMEVKGYGKSRILNNCTEGVKCSEAQHRLNRRVEFVLE